MTLFPVTEHFIAIFLVGGYQPGHHFVKAPISEECCNRRMPAQMDKFDRVLLSIAQVKIVQYCTGLNCCSVLYRFKLYSIAQNCIV